MPKYLPKGPFPSLLGLCDEVKQAAKDLSLQSVLVTGDVMSGMGTRLHEVE